MIFRLVLGIAIIVLTAVTLCTGFQRSSYGDGYRRHNNANHNIRYSYRNNYHRSNYHRSNRYNNNNHRQSRARSFPIVLRNLPELTIVTALIDGPFEFIGDIEDWQRTQRLLRRTEADTIAAGKDAVDFFLTRFGIDCTNVAEELLNMPSVTGYECDAKYGGTVSLRPVSLSLEANYRIRSIVSNRRFKHMKDAPVSDANWQVLFTADIQATGTYTGLIKSGDFITEGYWVVRGLRDAINLRSRLPITSITQGGVTIVIPNLELFHATLGEGVSQGTYIPQEERGRFVFTFNG